MSSQSGPALSGVSQSNPILALLLSSSSGRLYQKVASELARQIVRGDYTAGTRLPAERKLAEHFEVSRPTIREAIIALELAGCVEVKGGSGVYVIANEAINQAPEGTAGAQAQTDELAVLEARLLLEPEIAAMATQTISDQELDALSRELDAPSAFNQEPAAFHTLIAKATHNAVLMAIGEPFWSIGSAHARPMSDADNRCCSQERRAILAALTARDPSAARAAMRYHLSNTAERLTRLSGQSPPEAEPKNVAQEREPFAMVL
ncbi:MAG TPA: FadR/GntR family transcriptional regulator [Marinagarivorans sp.]